MGNRSGKECFGPEMPSSSSAATTAAGGASAAGGADAADEMRPPQRHDEWSTKQNDNDNNNNRTPYLLTPALLASLERDVAALGKTRKKSSSEVGGLYKFRIQLTQARFQTLEH
jgi:hypothetical protein